jgi:hypothetical protein
MSNRGKKDSLPTAAQRAEQARAPRDRQIGVRQRKPVNLPSDEERRSSIGSRRRIGKRTQRS